MAPSSTTTTGGAADARLLGVLAALASVGAATFWLLRNRRPREGKVSQSARAVADLTAGVPQRASPWPALIPF